jgi:hypothetical protein
MEINNEEKLSLTERYIEANAIGIAEGWIESNTEEDYIKAWQTLINKGTCWRLQGWFGRVAKELINQGICKG